jgi:hypothetical protein
MSDIRNLSPLERNNQSCFIGQVAIEELTDRTNQVASIMKFGLIPVSALLFIPVEALARTSGCGASCSLSMLIPTVAVIAFIFFNKK